MDQIRTFTLEDIPSVADLFMRIFRQKEQSAPESLKAYFKEFYFRSPWYDESLPSFVFETQKGTIAGFFGVMPFRMSFNGQPIQAAIGGNYMVDPAIQNPFAGVRLLKKFLDGPQDLSMTDTSTDYARKLWEGLGGKTCQLNSMHWTRILRPSLFATTYLAKKNKFVAKIEFAAKPICAILDSIIAKPHQSPFSRIESQDIGSNLSIDTLLEAMKEFSEQRSLRPVYDHETLSWIVSMMDQKTEYGKLHRVAVHSKEHNLLGWYLYYPNPGNVAQVVQVAGKKDSIDRVFEHLLSHAWDQGSVALEGRLEPKFIKEYSYKHCMFYQGGRYIMMRARNSEILQAVFGGDAFLSRMEGEWWNRFQGDTFD